VPKAKLKIKKEDKMQNSEKLKNLLENEIIPDLESAIDELFEIIEKSKKASSEQKNDFEELREMRTECFSIIDELSRNELEEDEIIEILDELMELKSNEE
jgi:hypothetical protein